MQFKPWHALNQVMEAGRKEHWLRLGIPLALILALGAIVRFRGLGWGLPSVGFPHPPYHPDETWAMNIMRALDPVALQFNPHDAHREGTLAYYLWLGVAGILRATGAIATLPVRFPGYGADYATFLYWGRAMNGLLDLGSIALVYFTLRRTCRGPAGPALGALTLAVAPFEAIYGHYLRNHIAANFFITLTIFLSTPLLERDDRRALGWAAFAAGLAAATRYPTGIVIAVPVMFWVARNGVRNTWKQPRELLAVSAQAAACLLIAFVIADPFLFFRFHAAQSALTDLGGFVATKEFHPSSLFDLSRIWAYFTYVIPYGTLPWLWAAFYASAIALLFVKQKRKFAWPLILFLFLYLYPMAKGYLATASFARGALPVYPVFALLVGAAYDELAVVCPAWLAGALAFFLLAPSFLYDLAYTRAMQEPDPRDQLHAFLETLPAPSTIAYRPGGFDYFLVLPAFAGIRPEQARPVTDGSADYLVLTAFQPGDDERTQTEIASLEAEHRYILKKVFSNSLHFAGVSFNFAANPHDLQYPLPRLYLLQAQNQVNAVGTPTK